ncbi:exotoxin [Staphylococcus aureus]|nr:exotoxin [Staphylococcus aureus]
MKKNITNKIILTATLLILGTSSAQLPNTPIGFSSEAKAYHIGQDETNINELIKYYTQKPLTFSNRWLYQYDDGNIYVEILGLHIYAYGVLKVGATLIN